MTDRPPASTPPALDVERLARSLPDVMDQAVCDEVYGPGRDPLDIADEWYMTPRDLAEHAAAEYASLTSKEGR